MITIQKFEDQYYIKTFSLETKEFNAVLLVMRTRDLRYVQNKGHTHSNPKVLLEIVDELADEFDTFVKDTIREEIENYNPYVASFKPRRLKIEKSF